MKKLVMALALIASTVAVASTDVYTFKSNIKFPAIKITKTAAWREAVSTTMNGTLTVASEDGAVVSNVLDVVVKKTGERFVFELDENSLAVLLGKTGTSAGSLISAPESESAEGGKIQFAAAGYGKAKVKTLTTGCGPCGDSTTETCTRITKISGHLVGLYTCPCDNG